MAHADEVTRPVSPITAAALAMKAEHAALLAGGPSFTETTEQRRAAEAIDAARERLQGRREPAAQLSLDVMSLRGNP